VAVSIARHAAIIFTFLALEFKISPAAMPDDARLIDVKSGYAASGDSVHDDTEALESAIRDNVGTHATLYLPSGTYRIRRPLLWKNSDGQWRSYLTIQGDGPGETVILLDRESPGFTDPSVPAAVITTASKTDDPACSNYGRDNENGGGNCGFGNYLFDLAIRVGEGNPGAVGLDFIASNYGAVVNVKIESADGGGVYGLDLSRGVGPCLFKDIEIEGFDCGIRADGELYGMTFDRIRLKGQKLAGIYNNNNALSFYDVTSVGDGPAVINEGIGLVTMVKGQFGGNSSVQFATRNNGDNAVLYLRDIESDGYDATFNSTPSAGNSIAEYVSHTVLSLFGQQDSMALKLPIEPSSTTPAVDVSLWANVENFGAGPNDQTADADAIQQAVNSGKPVVYFPFGSYGIDKTIRIEKTVRITGFSSYLNCQGASPVFEFAGREGDTVIIERFRFSRDAVVRHDCPGVLVFRHCEGANYEGTGKDGRLFLEDYCCGTLQFNSQKVWARHLNTEGGGTRIVNKGSVLWILGIKTEGQNTVVSTQDSGSTELLGGMLYPVGGVGEDTPAFENIESSHSLVYSQTAYGENLAYSTHVRETIGGETRLLGRSDGLAWHGYGSIMPLYVGVGKSKAYTGGKEKAGRRSTTSAPVSAPRALICPYSLKGCKIKTHGPVFDIQGRMLYNGIDPSGNLPALLIIFQSNPEAFGG
jgi:hypothetical protein